MQQMFYCERTDRKLVEVAGLRDKLLMSLMFVFPQFLMNISQVKIYLTPGFYSDSTFCMVNITNQTHTEAVIIHTWHSSEPHHLHMCSLHAQNKLLLPVL